MPGSLHRRVGALATILPLIVASAAFAVLDPPLRLSVDQRFPAPGGTIVFSVTGPAGADVKIQASPRAERNELPAWGTVFLDVSKLVTVGSAVLSPAGEATVEVRVPDVAERLDQLLFFQAAGRQAGAKGVSNSLSVRISTSPPAGPRKPGAVAVDRAGTIAWVAHELDGTLSVVDLVSGIRTDDLPVAVPDASPVRGIALELDTDGRHLFVVDPRRREIPFLHALSGSVSGSIPVSAGSRDVAFDFSGERRLYVSNERDDQVLVFVEEPVARFTLVDTLALQGRGPGPIAVDGRGHLLVGQWVTHELEIVDPSVPGGAPVARVALAGVPVGIVVVGDRALVSTFRPGDGLAPGKGGTGDGNNVVVEVDLTTGLAVADHFLDLGTDYGAADALGGRVAVLAQGSGSLLVADSGSLALLDQVDLAPGAPTTHPLAVRFVPDGQGAEPRSLVTLQHFRETLRLIDLASGPPFVPGAEIPLAWSGAPRVPGIDLDPLEEGEWLFATVEFFNGTADLPNRVTCATCHPRGFSSGLNHPATPNGKQAQVLFDTGSTGPWLHKGNVPDLVTKTAILFVNHGTVGGQLDPGKAQSMTDLQADGFDVAVSPFLRIDGSLSAAAERGKVVFEGSAACATCHVAPLFIPVAPDPLTIEQGVGTGLVPANVPSLRGLWASAPYLWQGEAATLMDVLTTANPDDLHGTTSNLTPQELEDLVAYLQSL